MSRSRTFFLISTSILFGSSLFAQNFRIGFVGGTRITSDYTPATYIGPGDAFNPPYVFTTGTGPRSFIGGLSVEALVNNKFSLEADVLHRDLWAKWTSTVNPGTTAASTTVQQFVGATTWEFPVLLKYTMGTNRWRPFLDAGASFRSLERTPAPGPSRTGFTGGGGVAFHFGRFQIAPQLRYTRWGQGASNGYYDVKRDQVEFLTAFSYRMPTALRAGNRRIALGLLAGASLNQTLAWANFGAEKRVLAGVSLDLTLNRGLSLEADGIYKPIGHTGYSVITWVFPVLLKYRWHLGPAPLFTIAGPSFRASGNLQDPAAPSNFGFTAGLGFEKRTAHIGLAPSFRYTRWKKEPEYRFAGPPYKSNSLELLVGVSF